MTNKLLILICLSVLITLNSVAKNTEVNGGPSTDLVTFNGKIKPLLTKYCYDCHGPKKAKADLRLDKLNPDLINGDDGDVWREVLDNINLQDMPPPKEKLQFSSDQRRAVVDWLSESLKKAVEVNKKTQKHTSFRRMTKYEYSYTLSDMLKLDFPINTDELPKELYSPEGLLNNSKFLIMSAVQLENYRKIAQGALERAALYPATKPESMWYQISPERPVDKRVKGLGIGAKKSKSPVPPVRKGLALTWSRNGHGYEFSMMGHPENGYKNYLPKSGRVHLRLRVTKTKPGRAVLSVRFGYRSKNLFEHGEIAKIKIDAPVGEARFYDIYFDARDLIRNAWRYVPKTDASKKIKRNELLYIGSIPVKDEASVSPKKKTEKKSNKGDSSGSESGFLSKPKKKKSNSKKEESKKKEEPKRRAKPEPKAIDSNLYLDYMEMQTHAYDQYPPESSRNIFIKSSNSSNKKVYAREVIENFMSKAYRRPVHKDEVDRIFNLYENISNKKSFEEDIITILSYVLTTPEFVYISDDSSNSDTTYVSDHLLASRLSYFIWSSVPDEELLKLAKSGSLKEASVISAQVKRMLENPKSRRLAEHYAYQWLDVEKMSSVCVDEEYFENYNDTLKASLSREPIEFFHEILKSNLSILNFIDSDFVVIDRVLASHYGLQHSFKFNEFKKVSTQGPARGGVMTQGSFLIGASDGTDSHPIKRGMWILERILNDTPPPPPGNVQPLDEANESFKGLSLKQKLILHREKEGCKDCHKKIDPWGVIFENYNTIGAWRNSINRKRNDVKDKSVDPSTELSDGTHLKDIGDLKKYLLNKKEEKFTRGFVERMCSYALGRTLGYVDRDGVDKIYVQFKKEGYKLANLIVIISQSELFRRK